MNSRPDPTFDFEKRPDEIDRMIAAVNASGAPFFVVGLGGGRQEPFLVRHGHRMPGVRLWLPLGGTIGSESGTFARPPAWITDRGFGWLCRLLREPRARFHRYVVHEPPFVLAVLCRKLGRYRDPFGRAAPPCLSRAGWVSAAGGTSGGSGGGPVRGR